jgi:PBP1b-binding outer membrane lipoprotein LpoB
MKRLLLAVTCVAVVLGGCSSGGKKNVAARKAPVKVAAAPVQTPTVDAKGEPIAHVPFRPGISSVTVENMAKKQGCTGGVGAGLMTPPGPVEVYRMVCDNRTVYQAKCELRQCKAI